MIVYVLKLQHGCYYVGRTTNLHQRLNQHKSGCGSVWVKKHPMIELIRSEEEPSPFYEDMIVKETMNQYGIHKVRGGSYSQPWLSKDQIKFLTIELRGATDKCFQCGGDHFVIDCRGSSSEDESEDESEGDFAHVEPLPTIGEKIAASAGRKINRLMNYFGY